MNSTLDENLAQTLFERGAEKCKNNSERIQFCKKYLIQHGVSVYNTFETDEESLITKEYVKRPREPEQVYVYHAKNSISTDYMGRFIPDETVLREMRESVRTDLVKKLMMDMVRNKFIHFEEHENIAMNTYEIHAAIKVAKWRKSNVR